MRSPISLKQKQFLHEPLHEFNILWGVTGSGKTFITNLYWYDYIVSQVPDGKLLMISGNTSESLYDNVIRELLEFDKGIGNLEYVAVKGHQRLLVRNKDIEIACVGANNERAKDRIQGKNVYAWLADEITKHPKSFVEMALSRLRDKSSGEMTVQPCIWTLNPDHPSHFVKTEYIDREDEETEDIKNWVFQFEDNPLISPEYVEKQKTRFTGVFFDRMILNKWTFAEGVIYDKFNRDAHVLDEIPTERIKSWFLGIDWGYENPLAILLIGEDGDGVYYETDEIYVKHQVIDDSIKSLLAKWDKYKIECAYADSNRPEFIMQFAEITGIDTYAAKKDVIEGIHEVQKCYRKRGDGQYSLYTHKSCKNLIREKESYVWKENRAGDTKDEPKKENDHLPDSERYVIYTRKDAPEYGEDDKLIFKRRGR